MGELLQANGLLASCSNEMRADNLSAQLVASTLDDPSHSRILMRISRKKNGSTPEPTCSALSGQLSGLLISRVPFILAVCFYISLLGCTDSAIWIGHFHFTCIYFNATYCMRGVM